MEAMVEYLANYIITKLNRSGSRDIADLEDNPLRQWIEDGLDAFWSINEPESIGKWSTGRTGCVVSDIPTTKIESTGHSDTAFYGGYLVCESIPTKKISRLIAAAPMLLEACRQASENIVKQANLLSTASTADKDTTIERLIDWLNNSCIPAIAAAEDK